MSLRQGDNHAWPDFAVPTAAWPRAPVRRLHGWTWTGLRGRHLQVRPRPLRLCHRPVRAERVAGDPRSIRPSHPGGPSGSVRSLIKMGLKNWK